MILFNYDNIPDFAIRKFPVKNAFSKYCSLSPFKVDPKKSPKRFEIFFKSY